MYSLLGASACVQLNRFEEAITWCDKGLAVSFTAVDSDVQRFLLYLHELPAVNFLRVFIFFPKYYLCLD